MATKLSIFFAAVNVSSLQACKLQLNFSALKDVNILVGARIVVY